MRRTNPKENTTSAPLIIGNILAIKSLCKEGEREKLRKWRGEELIR